MIMITNVYVQRMRDKRKEQGLCIYCGNPIDTEGSRCTECKKKFNNARNKDRKFLQSIGICPRCQKNKLYGDEKQCPECSAKGYSLAMKSRERLGKEHYNKNHAEWSKKEHHRRIEQGICTRCGKCKADYGFKTCGICRDKERKYKCVKYGKPDRSERYKQGLCYFCDNPIKNGYKVCEKHYQMNVEKANSNKAKDARKKLIDNKILY